MAHSFIEFCGKQCLLNDAEIALVVYAVLAEVTYQQPTGDNLTDSIRSLLAWWAQVIDTCGPGCIDLEMDSQLKNPADKVALAILLRSAKARLLSQGATVNLIETKTRIPMQSIRIADVLPQSNVARTFDAVLSLID